MTLYLWIAAYLACAVLAYGIICGLIWSDEGARNGWETPSSTRVTALTASIWPFSVPALLIMYVCLRLGRPDHDWLSPWPRWYFRSRKPASRVQDENDWIAYMVELQKKGWKQLAESHNAIAREMYRTYGPQEGTVAHKMRSLSEDAEKLRAEQEAVRVRRLKLDALSWAVEKISHTAKAGFRSSVFNDDPLNTETWAGCKAVASALPGSYCMRSEVLPFLNDSLSGMGFRCNAAWGGKGDLHGIIQIEVEW